MNRLLRLLLKIIATLLVVIPGILSAATIVLVCYESLPLQSREGNVGDLLVGLLFIVTIPSAIIVLIWSVIQMVFLPFFWRNQGWAYISLSIFSILPGAGLICLCFWLLQNSVTYWWIMGVVGFVYVSNGMFLIIARRYTSARKSHGRGFQVVVSSVQ